MEDMVISFDPGSISHPHHTSFGTFRSLQDETSVDLTPQNGVRILTA